MRSNPSKREWRLGRRSKRYSLSRSYYRREYIKRMVKSKWMCNLNRSAWKRM